MTSASIQTTILVEALGGDLDFQVSEDIDFDEAELNLVTGVIRNRCKGRGIASFHRKGSSTFRLRVNGRELELQGSRRRNTLTGRSLALVVRAMHHKAHQRIHVVEAAPG